ncbi:Nn.00g024800.m01.CDS01 [Neocucurbitaria sp. VM-36]
MEAAVNTLAHDPSDTRFSDLAKRLSRWKKWCRVLKQHGEQIDEILQSEGIGWLARYDWKEKWMNLYPEIVVPSREDDSSGTESDSSEACSEEKHEMEDDISDVASLDGSESGSKAEDTSTELTFMAVDKEKDINTEECG